MNPGQHDALLFVKLQNVGDTLAFSACTIGTVRTLVRSRTGVTAGPWLAFSASVQVQAVDRLTVFPFRFPVQSRRVLRCVNVAWPARQGLAWRLSP